MPPGSANLTPMRPPRQSTALPRAALAMAAALACLAPMAISQDDTPTRQEPEKPQDPQTPVERARQAERAVEDWLNSDLQDQTLLDTAVAKMVDNGRAAISSLSIRLRKAAASPNLPHRTRIGLDSLTSNFLLAVLEQRANSGMVFAGQYDDLRELQPTAGTFLTNLVVDTPDWFPDNMRVLVVPALRDIYPNGPGQAVIQRLVDIAEDEDFEAQPLREAVGYALAGWGDRRFVQDRIDELERNAGERKDSEELHFVRELAFVHYNLRDYASGASNWQTYRSGMRALEAPLTAHDHYNAACCLALSGQRDAALAAIEDCAERIASGPLDTTAELNERMFDTDPDLRAIRPTDRFRAAQHKAFPPQDTRKPSPERGKSDRDGAPR